MEKLFNFVTSFDSNYLTRGLALYRSLCNVCGDSFHLYIIAFDDEAYRILSDMKLPQITLISMNEFEDKRLLEIKPARTKQEYAWTCSSFSVLYVLNHFPVVSVTYLDADLYFFSSPEILFEEMKQEGKDVLITRHNYSPEYDQSARSGIYCVQYLTFMNNMNGFEVIRDWTDKVEEWCYSRVEDGKFGDQKYLDDWTDRFPCVHVTGNKGAGVAPWNITGHLFSKGPKVDDTDIVFCHFHAVKWLKLHKFDLAVYRLTEDAIHLLFEPYCLALQKENARVSSFIGKPWNKGFFQRKKTVYETLRWIKNSITRIMNGTYNVRVL